MTTAWVVLPTYNERENLPTVVALARAALATLRPAGRRHVLVVDDASPDGTGELADALAREHADVRVLHRARKGGLGGAYVAGFDEALAAGADLVIEMDADLSHDPADLPRLIDAARDGADVVLGSRYMPGGGVEGWPLHRRLLSRAGGRYAAAVLGLPSRDLTGGFKCFRAGALRAIDRDLVRSRGYAFQIELTYQAARAGLRDRRGPDRVPRARARALEDVAGDRARGDVAGPAHAPAARCTPLPVRPAPRAAR